MDTIYSTQYPYTLYSTATSQSVHSLDDKTELNMGRVHPRVRLDWVGSGPDFFLTWWVRSGRVKLCGSAWVTLDDTESYAKFSGLLVLFMFEFSCTLCLRHITLSLNFLRRFLIFCTN